MHQFEGSEGGCAKDAQMDAYAGKNAVVLLQIFSIPGTFHG